MTPLPHIWGGKGVGSQGDGTAQILARSADDQQAVIEISSVTWACHAYADLRLV
jgi:hypothetical protein